MAKRFVTYKQIDSMDCGPTCLRMVARHYGRRFELPKLREYCYASKNGVSLLGINEAAERIGFRCRGVKSNLDRLVASAIFPCIVHWREEHFVVVTKMKVKKDRNGNWIGKIYVADPAFGMVEYSVEEFLDGWINDKVDGKDKGTFLILVPTLEFYHPDDDEQGKKYKLSNFFSYIRPFKKMFIQVILGMIISMAFSFILPFLTQSTVDVGIMNNNMNFIYLILTAQLIIALSELVISYLQGWILLHTTSRISIALISDFVTKMLRLPISFFESRKTGDIIQRIGDNSRVQSFIMGSVIATAMSFLSFFVFAIILGYYNLYMLLIFVGGHALYITWILLFLKIRRELDFKHFDKAAKTQSNIIEIITGAEDIKLNGSEQKMRNKWESIQAELFKISTKGLKVSQTQGAGAFFFSNITNITLSVFSAYLVINGEITLGMMMSLSYIIGQLKGPVGAFIGFVHSYQDAKISLERLGEVHMQKDEESMSDDTHNYIRDMASRDIVLQNVSFSYQGINSPTVLSNVSFVIPQNKITAIVGESGSGKTTLIKLLLSYFDPLNGEIRVGNTQLKNIDKNYWRRNCSVVMQNGYIFSTSIAENIALSDEITDRDKLFNASVTANIHDFIEQLPSGYNTKIGPEGSGLSQGQRQRLLIARAIYKDANFIFFDEATNSLDANNERAIIENLKAVFNGKTAVIVAHRLSTVRNADQIVVLDNGHVAEIGTHDSLIAKQGIYYRLVKNQLEL